MTESRIRQPPTTPQERLARRLDAVERRRPLVSHVAAGGPAGPTGAAGSVWYEGTGAPAGGTGVNGDFYLNDANGDVYQKAGGSWSVVANIKGPAGANGTNGADGADGTVWYEGTGAPGGGLGVLGDFYLNDANGDVYQNQLIVGWIVVANIKGPTGATGADGAAGAPGSVATFPCQGRLTVQSGTPVGSGSAQSTLYFTPYQGSALALYDGSAWDAYTLTERSIALSGLTASRPYDVFIYDNAGTLTLELVAWTNDTTRATAIAYQDGVPCKSGTLTKRYLGTIRTTGTNTTEDSTSKRFVWNCYNRVRRALTRIDTTASWTYQTNTWRQARAQAANQVEHVVGLREDSATITLQVSAAAGSGSDFMLGIGANSTTAPSFGEGPAVYNNQALETGTETVVMDLLPTLGYSYYAWLERVPTTTNAATFIGQHATLTGLESMLSAEVYC